ncbi:hypothetical protein [Clostridium senegalense]|uniref:hypothetical protein n=1 Tax=Clostridium senegalense TaxID=1465809 RepID=UPI0002887CB5|nr:hypothetical protein [Clostridium senegalense]
MKNELNKLKFQNEINTENLNEINQKTLTHILCYFKTFKIGAFDREVIRKDLIGMAIEAENRNETLSNIIGNDEKSWCDSILDSYGKVSFKELILSIINQISPCWIIWGIIFFNITPEKVPVDTTWLLVSIGYSVLMTIYNIFILPKFSFDPLIKQYTIEISLFIVISLLMIFILTFFDRVVLFVIPNYIMHLLSVTIWFISSLLYNNLLHKQSLKINWME